MTIEAEDDGYGLDLSMPAHLIPIAFLKKLHTFIWEGIDQISEDAEGNPHGAKNSFRTLLRQPFANNGAGKKELFLRWCKEYVQERRDDGVI